jgi:hypothetical protein
MATAGFLPNVLICLCVCNSSVIFSAVILDNYTYIMILKLIAVVVVAVGLLGCTSLGISRPSVETAAVADVATTYISLSSGGQELNPLGFWGTTAAKLYYLYGLRPDYTEQERLDMDRYVSSALTGATVNNVVQIIWAPTIFVSALLGFAVAWSAYHSDLPVKVEPAR